MHGRNYYRSLHYLMGDYSGHVLERAWQQVAHHGEHVSALVLDASRPQRTLGFLKDNLLDAGRQVEIGAAAQVECQLQALTPGAS